MEFISNYLGLISDFLKSGGIFFGVCLVLLESIIPALPLSVFIGLNVSAYGVFIGILASWFGTIIGCYIAYSISKCLSVKFLDSHIKSKKIRKMTEKVKKMPFPNLAVLMAIPFSPSFLINITCGLSQMTKKKFMTAVLIGKISITIFWGCVSKSLIESMTDINTIIIIIIFILIAYIVSRIVNKKLDIE